MQISTLARTAGFATMALAGGALTAYSAFDCSGPGTAGHRGKVAALIPGGGLAVAGALGVGVAAARHGGPIAVAGASLLGLGLVGAGALAGSALPNATRCAS